MHRFIRLPALLAALALACILGRPAAAENIFAVPNVHVQAAGASTSEARARAIAGGRPVAWQRLYRRLTRAQDWARFPVLDDAQLQKLIISYVPANERRSTTQYVADVTYVFNPDAVTHLLQSLNIPYAAAPTKRILLVPMAPFYSRSSMWTMAFASPRFSNSYVPFAVPVGDVQDMAALRGLDFDTARWADIAPVAARIHANEAVLVKAEPVGSRLVVTLKRLGAGQLPAVTSVQVPLIQGAESTYPSAADAAVRAMEQMWKNQKVVDFSQKGRLTADVRIASLPQFAALQRTLAGIPNVASVTVAAMDIGQARITINYLGTMDQLRDALAQADVTLAAGPAGAWQISGTPQVPQGAASQP